MKTVLVLGATGCLGSHILEVLREKGYKIRATARTALKADQLRPSVHDVVICNPTKQETLTPELIQGVDFIISAMGKSLSLKDTSRSTFHDVDYQGNLNILKLAQAQGQVQKFVYVAALSGEKHPSVAYFKAHEDFARALQHSSIANTIIKPPALYSAVLELVPMARKGQLASVGPGNHVTNPIHEHEVAEACVQALTSPDTVVELGGPVNYSRMDLIKMVGKKVGHYRTIPQVPYWVANTFLPMIKLVSKSLFEKAAFFVAVTKTDCAAPVKGQRRLEEYLAEHV